MTPMWNQATTHQLKLRLPQALQRAIAFHEQGRLQECEQLYLQVLETKPDQFDAQHLLGVVRYQQGRYQEALELISSALAISPQAPEALSNYGVVLQRLGRYEEAV